MNKSMIVAAVVDLIKECRDYDLPRQPVSKMGESMFINDDVLHWLREISIYAFKYGDNRELYNRLVDLCDDYYFRKITKEEYIKQLENIKNTI